MPFVIDTSIWIRIGQHYPLDIFRGFWRQLDQAIARGVLISPEEVLHELERGEDDLAQILAQRDGLFAPLDEPLQEAVREVMARCPGLADLEGERNRADPFVVALARVRDGTVVTGERPRRSPTGPPKIPDACDILEVGWHDWFGFLRAVGWDL